MQQLWVLRAADGKPRAASTVFLLPTCSRWDGGRGQLTRFFTIEVSCPLLSALAGSNHHSVPSYPAHPPLVFLCKPVLAHALSLLLTSPVPPLYVSFRSPVRRMTAATLSLLLGFFSATSAATIIGSVADWDPLAAGKCGGRGWGCRHTVQAGVSSSVGGAAVVRGLWLRACLVFLFLLLRGLCMHCRAVTCCFVTDGIRAAVVGNWTEGDDVRRGRVSVGVPALDAESDSSLVLFPCAVCSSV